MNNRVLRLEKIPMLSVAAGVFLLATPMLAQSTAPQDNRPVQSETPRSEVAGFDHFLDSHPEIAEQVRRNPSLLDDRDFVQDHPALRNYLEDNPGVRAQLRQDPNGFMHQENGFDRTENDRDRDSSRRDLAEFDRFLDSHPETAEPIRRNPSLVDDREFVQNHPALRNYLEDNPGVRAQLRQDPNGFMHQENGFDRTENGRDRDPSRRDLAEFNRFLDSHPETAEQIRRDPSLVENREFVQKHPALQTYLQDNPGLRDQMRQDPNAFLRQENRFDDAANRRDRDPSHEHLASFGEFLGGHTRIAQDVSKNPSLVKNQEYVENHRELNEYLNAHPEVRNEWAANPQGFVKGAQQFTNAPTNPGTGNNTPTNVTGHTGTNGNSTGGSNGIPAPTPKPKQ